MELEQLLNLYNYLLSADTKTVHEIVHIPLVNTDGEEEASVIGRSSEDPLRTGINRAGKVEKSAMDEGNVCSAR